jgi:hypothetical protein
MDHLDHLTTRLKTLRGQKWGPLDHPPTPSNTRVIKRERGIGVLGPGGQVGWAVLYPQPPGPLDGRGL